MKVLITAGNGFIARNLTEQLKGEYSAVSCNSSELNLLDTVKVYSYLRDNKFDVVIHTATHDPAPRYSTKDPQKVLENNLKMFFNVARAQGHFGKMLFFGSGAEYDRDNWKPKMKEYYFDKHVPTSQYAFSKYIMTKYAELGNKIYNLRIYSVFGKYEDWRYRFISRSCCRAIFDLPIIIGQNVNYDYLYVDDLTKVVKWFIEKDPKRHAYNVCSGTVFDSGTLAEKVLKISGKKLDIIVESEGEGVEYSGDVSLLLEEFKDFKCRPIDGAIHDLYAWYDSHRDMIDKREL